MGYIEKFCDPKDHRDAHGRQPVQSAQQYTENQVLRNSFNH
jgi:hypothetical protein